MRTLRVRAPAKINLHLQVLGPRNDGYHEVWTLMQTIGLFDELHATIAPAEVLELHVRPEGVLSSGGDNLVLRAAESLRRLSGAKAGARIELDKRIPIGAGLGGGSSDAAATLVLLGALWALHLEQSEFDDLAAGLGSDVPFFLHGGLAVASGRGEVIRPLPDLRNHDVVLCVPPITVSTADVYGRFAAGPRLTSRRPEDTVEAFAAGLAGAVGCVMPPWSDLGNDLEPVVIENWPEVGRVLAALEATAPLHAAVTGSGAAAYAVYPDLEEARNAASGLDDDWRVYLTTTIGRSRGCPMVE